MTVIEVEEEPEMTADADDTDPAIMPEPPQKDQNDKEDAINHSDLEFLEGQSKKIIERCLRIFSITGILACIYLLAMGALLSYFSGELLFFLIFLAIVLILVATRPTLMKRNKEFRNLMQWKEHFKNKDRDNAGESHEGRLENIMRIVSSIDSWLNSLYKIERNLIVVLVLFGLLTIQSFSWRNIFDHSDHLPYLLAIQIIICLMGAWAISYAVLWYNHQTRMNFWRPRLETFRTRLDDYWGQL